MAGPASNQRLRLADLHDGARLVVEGGCYGSEADTVVEVEATPDGLGFCTADAHMRAHHSDKVDIRWTLLADIVDEDGFLRGVRRHAPIPPAPLAAPVGKHPEPQALRWKVTLIYRSEYGPVDVTHEVEELSEIEDLVERGPDWNTLILYAVMAAARGSRLHLYRVLVADAARLQEALSRALADEVA